MLVDFWTYTCINCLRTLPYLKAWDARYRKDGLTIVGVHSPEFPFEKDAGNVADAIERNGLRYPVAQDNDLATWSAYGNQYWPAEYFVDAQGNVRFVHFGEGSYGEKEQVIRELLAEAGHRVPRRMSGAHGIAPSATVTTPESYLGTARAARFVNPILSPGLHDFGQPHSPPPDQLAYRGRWRLTKESATAAGGSLELNFGARRVYLVLGSPGRARTMRVLLDGQPIPAALAGADVHGGVVEVDRAAPLQPRRPAPGRPPRPAPAPRAGGDGLRLHLRLAAELAGYHHLLDLVGALADREDLGVAVEAADRVLLDVAVAAVDLDRLLGRSDREAAGDQLRLRGGEGERLAGVLLQRGAPGEQAGGLDLGGEVGDLRLDRLELGDRLAEGAWRSLA